MTLRGNDKQRANNGGNGNSERDVRYEVVAMHAGHVRGSAEGGAAVFQVGLPGASGDGEVGERSGSDTAEREKPVGVGGGGRGEVRGNRVAAFRRTNGSGRRGASGGGGRRRWKLQNEHTLPFPGLELEQSFDGSTSWDFNTQGMGARVQWNGGGPPRGFHETAVQEEGNIRENPAVAVPREHRQPRKTAVDLIEKRGALGLDRRWAKSSGADFEPRLGVEQARGVDAALRLSMSLDTRELLGIGLRASLTGRPRKQHRQGSRHEQRGTASTTSASEAGAPVGVEASHSLRCTRVCRS